MNQFQPTRFQVLPLIVKNLLIINGLLFLATITFGSTFNLDLTKIFGLHFMGSSDFMPFQFITYMFMHGGFTHILFNMFALWMFGNVLENVWGPKRFLLYYMVTGVGAGIVYTIWIYFQMSPTLELIEAFMNNHDMDALAKFTSMHTFQLNEYSGQIWNDFQQFKLNLQHLTFNPDDAVAMQSVINFVADYKEFYLNQSVVVGASGAVFGILLAFGMMFPNSIIYIYFAIPMKAKYFVMLYGAFELFEGWRNSGDNVAHFAHLGGMLFGILLILYWKKKGTLNR
ncbi:MAG: rhomboid family intramembrane serine protease [Bacteroidales bacterium]|nr:rhomboid family intramembrane serine protease [Bacteroidales bacterium]